jgi:hypothetical protein
MQTMQLFTELIEALVEYSVIDRLLDIKLQLERDISVIGPEERLILKYTMVCNGIETILEKQSKPLLESIRSYNEKIETSVC